MSYPSILAKAKVMPNIFRTLPLSNRQALHNARIAKFGTLDNPKSQGFAKAIQFLKPASNVKLDVTDDAVRLHGDLKESRSDWTLRLNQLIPWKKGPFELFGVYIDSEWRSEMKWHRLLPFIGSLKDKDVLDIGCNNGYYMFKLLELEPQSVLGLEPYPKHWFSFNLINY